MITLFLLALASTALMLCSAPVVLFALMLESCGPPRPVPVEQSTGDALPPSSHTAAAIV